MKKLLIIFSLTILLSACSPEDLFSMLAQSEVEQAAGEQVKTADETVLDFESLIKQKSTNFENSIKLTSVVNDVSYGTAFVNYITSENKEFSHQVWAILPPLEEEGAFYEGWLVNPSNSKFVSTGPMKLSEDNKIRYLEFFTNVDLADYSQVVITKELIRDTIPETHIIEGEFN